MSFKAILEKYRKIVEDELDRFLAARVNEVKEPYLKQNYIYAKEYVLNGGKRLRPIALIMSYKGVGGKRNEVYKSSLSVELLHNSTLVHDDVMDEDDVRRNKPTIHRRARDFYLKNKKESFYQGNLFNRASTKYAITDAVCIGNILHSLGLSCLQSIESRKIYCIADRVVNDGQILDNHLGIKKRVTEEDYLDMIARKTGNLFMASLQIGAVLGGANRRQFRALSNYAMLAAMAFQLKDDLMDISKDTKKGSTFGSDIRNGKRTLLLIKAMEKAAPKQKKILNSVVGNEKATLAQINQVAEIYHQTGAFDYVNSLAEEKINMSKEWLSKARLSRESKEFFEGFADYMLGRKV